MYQRILVPVDGSATSLRGLDEAVKLALPAGAQLRLIHVVDELSIAMTADSMGSWSGDVITALVQGGHELLAQAKAKAAAQGVAAETVLVERMSGRVCDHVVEEALKWRADLIVIGTHGRRGLGRLLLGSDAEQMLRLAPVPVLLVRDMVPVPVGDEARLAVPTQSNDVD